jgi:hypothetical protein
MVRQEAQRAGFRSRATLAVEKPSPTGAWGASSLATREKGKILIETPVSGIGEEIEALMLETPRGHISVLRAGFFIRYLPAGGEIHCSW